MPGRDDDNTRALSVTGVLPPTRVNWPLSSAPSKARCACGGRSSISLMNSVPAPARSSTPGATCAAGLGAEQHLLGAFAAQRARDERDERPRGARTGVVDETREGFAAGAGLADQQHGRIVGGDLREIGAQLLHDAAAAHGHARRRG